MAKYDVVIVGAGPGGLACGKKLAQNGKKTIIIEKNTVIGDKVCAGGVTAKEIDNIMPKKLIGRIFERGIVHFGDEGKRVVVNVPENSIGTISRDRLGEYMAGEVEKVGVELLRDTMVKKINNDHVIDQKGNRYYFDYLIGGDGSNSIIRKHLGLPTKKIGPTIQYKVSRIYDDIEIFYDFKNLGPLYIWIFPHDTFTEIGTGALSNTVPFSEVKEYFDKWLKKRDIDVSGAELRSFPINCDYQGFQFEKIFLIGDAAGFTDAFTGEGIYPAIISGQEAARKIIDPTYSLDKIQMLISRKRKAERALEFYAKYEKLTKRYGNIVGYRLAKSKRFQKKLIDAFLY